MPHLREAYRERYWPGDLKTVLDQLPNKRGTPRYIVVKDDVVVFDKFGEYPYGWKKTLAFLREALRS